MLHHTSVSVRKIAKYVFSLCTSVFHAVSFVHINLFHLQSKRWTHTRQQTVQETPGGSDRGGQYIQCCCHSRRGTVHMGERQLWPPGSWQLRGPDRTHSSGRTAGAPGCGCRLWQWRCSDCGSHWYRWVLTLVYSFYTMVHYRLLSRHIGLDRICVSLNLYQSKLIDGKNVILIVCHWLIHKCVTVDELWSSGMKLFMYLGLCVWL